MKKLYSFLVAALLSIVLLPAAPTMGLVFSGASTGFIDLGSTATAPTQFTVEAWVYYQSFPSGESAYILSSEDSPAAGPSGFSLRANGNKINLCIGNGNWINVVGATALSSNTWYHIAATCSASQIKVYVNGVLDGTTTLTAPMLASAKNLRIGDSPTWTGRLFNGIMADLRFWNVERTPAQIQSGMNAPLSGTETGLVANWKMNEGTGTAVADVRATYPITKPSDISWYYPVTGIAISGTTNYISSLAGTAQLAAIVTPSNAIQSVSWNVSNQGIASINATGLLTAKKNGSVSVTATSKDGSNVTSNSFQVTISNQPDIAPTRQLFIDFGPNDVSNGNMTPSPDVNGNYWNNALNEASGTTTALIDKANAATGFSLVIGTGMSKNGIQNGGLLAPNASYLGEFAIATATQDYFFGSAGSLKLTGLNPARGYRFKIFGSRDNTEVRISQFVFTGANTMTATLQTSGTNVGGAGVNRNVSNILSSDLIFPKANGEITIDATKTAGAFFHINAMKIEEYSSEVVPVSGITVTGSDITTTGTASQLVAVVSPANASVLSVTWTVSDPTIATIDVNGLLRPLKDGIVTVTATTKEAGSTVSASKQITISNQFLSLYFSGTATENGNNPATAIPMKLLTNLQGNSNGVFEIYTSLNATGTCNFYTSQGGNATVYGAGASAGTLSAGGAAIDPTQVGPVLITVDMAAKTYTILPITKMGVAGATGEAALTYKGMGVWSGLVNMANVMTDANKSFSFRVNSNSAYAIKRVKGTTTNAVKPESQAAASYTALEEIGLPDKGSYTLTLDMSQYSYWAVDSLRITVMGSSVPSGSGATNNFGYMQMYAQQLSQRYTQGKGANWNVVNKSIGGNTTVDVTGRVDRDLYPQCGRYVIFALSLGNEGIHGSTNQQAVFDQWKNNMLSLIAAARAKGLVPIVTNNYTRGDFDLSDYGYVKKMDLLIHEWDVPSVNLLGAIDDGAGRWAAGYQNGTDVSHPNDAGHAELSYAMVPSLYDALRAGKPAPVKATGNYMAFDNTSVKDQLAYTPDNTVHSFTVSFDIKTTGNGTVATFKQGTATGVLKIDATTGAVVYVSPNNAANKIAGSVAINDGQWHKVTLTHFYARGETDLYFDNTLAGKLTEKLIPTEFGINALNSEPISFRDWLFYRSGMNGDELTAMNAGRMLKSSLELYAPLYGQAATSDEQLVNLAQSTTVITKTSLQTAVTAPVEFSKLKLYPNPVPGKLSIEGLNPDKQYTCAIYNMEGRALLTGLVKNKSNLDVSSLNPSQYVLRLTDKTTSEKVAIVFTKE